MKVSDNPIYVNGSTLLTICQMKMWNIFGGTVPLGDTLTVPSNEVTNWTLHGDGLLLPLGAGTVYEAPGTKPVPDPVTVSADIENVKDGSGKSIGKLVLLTDILVLNRDTSSNASGETNDEGYFDFNLREPTTPSQFALPFTTLRIKHSASARQQLCQITSREVRALFSAQQPKAISNLGTLIYPVIVTLNSRSAVIIRPIIPSTILARAIQA